MKTIKWLLPLVLLAGILCGCTSLPGSSQTPYLPKNDRTAIEHDILDEITFTRINNGALVSFQYNSDQTLLDVDFISSETQTIFFTVPRVEKNDNCSLEVYSQEIVQTNGSTNIYIKYTVGDYTYRSDLTVPVILLDSQISEEASAYQITITTKDGRVQLEDSVPMEFFAGTEISGLKKFRIHSITANIPYEGAIDFEITGSDSDNYSDRLTAKLWNEDGFVVASGRVYIFDGAATIYCLEVDPGNYILTFEESA